MIIYNLNLYKMRKRERQKRLDKEYTIESNCIKREREKLDIIWKLYKMRKRERQKKLGRGVFLLYNYKCIGRKYMYLHVYIQFSHALYKEKHNYTFRFCLYMWERRWWRARFGRVAREIWKRGERGTKIYVFIQFSLLYTIRNNFYTLVFV